LIRVAVLFIAAYFAGSVSFSIILFKLSGKGDPRSRFSGNAGATNVYRQGGFLLAAVVLFLEIARAVAVARISVSLLPPDFVPWVCLGLILGNRFPCFHGFKGGKGVAGYLGFALAVVPVAALISMPVWLVVKRLFGLPFVASFAMVLVLAVGMLDGCGYRPVPGAGILMATFLVYYNHKPNLVDFVKRIRGGEGR
jgi:glycerol-3-phosphate acyltransferase PlsY